MNTDNPAPATTQRTGQSTAESTGLPEQAFAAPGPAINSLSPSRAADFLACPLRYRYRVIDRLPEPVSLAAVRGTVVHAVLENLFLAPAHQRTAEHAYTLIEPAWHQVAAHEPAARALMSDPPAAPPGSQTELEVDVPVVHPAAGSAAAHASGPGAPTAPAAPPRRVQTVPEEPVTTAQEFFAECRQLVDRYFSLEDPTRLEPQQRELYVSTTLDSGLQLRGIIDRLDVSPQGALRVVDYKTGRAPGEGYESSAMFQMRFYALVLWRMRQVIPQVLQMLYLGNGTVLRYEPDAEDLQATERKLTALWQAIARAHQSKDWRPRPSALCNSCAFKQDLCPAWGGVALPVPVPAPRRVSSPGGRGGGHDASQGLEQDDQDIQPELFDVLD